MIIHFPSYVYMHAYCFIVSLVNFCRKNLEEEYEMTPFDDLMQRAYYFACDFECDCSF